MGLTARNQPVFSPGITGTTTTTLAAGSNATSSYTPSNGVLNFGLPVGATGPKGDTGIAGPTGASGPIGLTGAKGDTGATGAAGPTAIGGVFSVTLPALTVGGLTPAQTVTVTGAALNDGVIVNTADATLLSAVSSIFGYVSAVNTVTIQVRGATVLGSAARTFIVTVVKRGA